MRAHPFSLVCIAIAALALAPAACSDPVRAQREAELGPETEGGPSPNHRPGQDCLVCHDEQGGATPTMIVAGTIFADPSPGAAGAENVEIQFTDAKPNGAPLEPIYSYPSGNFWVVPQQWPDIRFPFKVRLVTESNAVVAMVSTVNREGSCNFCHRPNPAPPYDEIAREIARRSTGQIYVSATPASNQGGGP
jgi:hypothetical protein